MQGADEGPKREIDVLASINSRTSTGLLRVSNIVECKWSLDKPWVIFTSPTTHLAPAACASQSISSVLGESIIWMIAGTDSLHSLQLFSTPPEGGFGGRQAFSKGNDPFYSAVQAAVGNSKSYVDEYDSKHSAGRMPSIGVIAFPIVLVEGEIIRAYYDASDDKLKLESAPYVRCHWKGSASWRFFATVDVVSLSHFDKFVEERARDTRVLLATMHQANDEIARYGESGNWDDLTISRGPRGTIGPPKLLREISKRHVKPKISEPSILEKSDTES